MKSNNQFLPSILITMAFCFLSHMGISQNYIPYQKKAHQIVIQLTSSDTLVHKSLMNQLSNLTRLSPDSKIEIVCHGPGLEILLDQSTVANGIQKYAKQGVVFLACENTMTQKSISKDRLLPNVNIVEGGILEIVTKQEQGWSYIKAGF